MFFPLIHQQLWLLGALCLSPSFLKELSVLTFGDVALAANTFQKLLMKGPQRPSNAGDRTLLARGRRPKGTPPQPCGSEEGLPEV